MPRTATRTRRARRTKGRCSYCGTALTVGQQIALIPGTGWVHSRCAVKKNTGGEHQVKTARYVGGPLDGQTVEKTGGRWSVYRDDDGQQISTARGDKEFYAGPRAGMPLTRYYHHQNNVRSGALPVGDLYIHASAWFDWMDSNR